MHFTYITQYTEDTAKFIITGLYLKIVLSSLKLKIIILVL